ncbi:hypothetical protein LTR95_019338, partial [Oleoguttula sp. CCFEE 5521]
DDEDDEDDSSDSSDGEVEHDLRPPVPGRPLVTTSQPPDSRLVDGHDHGTARTAIDSVQGAPFSSSMSPSPIPLSSRSESQAEVDSRIIEHDDPRSIEAEQHSQGEAPHEDNDEYWCGPQGTMDKPSAWQPVNGARMEDEAMMMIDLPQSTVPLFAHVVAQSISPERFVQSSPPTEVMPPQSDEGLEQTITAVSSAVFDATRPLPVDELRLEVQHGGEPLSIGDPSHSHRTSRGRSPVQQTQQVAHPPRHVSPIVSIPRTSPLGDVEDVVDISDLATDASGGEDLIEPDESAADEVDEGAGNEHEIELTGSSEEREETSDGTEENGEGSDVAAMSEAGNALPIDDLIGSDSSADTDDVMAIDDVDNADVMQSTEEDTAIEAFPDRSQEASQQLLNDAMNAMLAEQPTDEAQLKGSPSLLTSTSDNMAGDTVVPGSESSALAGSDTFAVIQRFDREVESPTLRRKRKMTGITSKHFTPVKSARKKRAEK